MLCRSVRVVRFVLLLVALAVAGACASRGPAPVAGPVAEPPLTTPPAVEEPRAAGPVDEQPLAEPVPTAPQAPAVGTGVVMTALAQQGVPYRWAGTDPSGFDCSGLVQYAFAQHGVALPRETVDQYTVGEPVALDALVPGDLVFFQTSRRGPSHVGIAIGNNQFVHAPSAGGVVRVERLTMIYWARRVLGARRVAPPDTLRAEARPASLVTAPAPPAPAPPARRVPRPRPFPGAPTD